MLLYNDIFTTQTSAFSEINQTGEENTNKVNPYRIISQYYECVRRQFHVLNVTRFINSELQIYQLFSFVTLGFSCNITCFFTKSLYGFFFQDLRSRDRHFVVLIYILRFLTEHYVNDLRNVNVSIIQWFALFLQCFRYYPLFFMSHLSLLYI